MSRLLTEIGGFPIISEKRLGERPKEIQDLMEGLGSRKLIGRSGSDILRTSYKIPESLLKFDPKVTSIFDDVSEGDSIWEKRIGYEVTTHWNGGRSNFVFVSVEDMNKFS